MAARGGPQSDEDQDIDVESDEDDVSSSYGSRDGCDPSDKKAHHNALERKRRDHIKESFVGLRDSLPNVKKEKVSRAQILQKATEYITYMTKKNGSIQKDIDTMRRQNDELKVKVHEAERSRSEVLQNSLNTPVLKEEVVEICDSSDVEVTYHKNNKRLKISTNE